MDHDQAVKLFTSTWWNAMNRLGSIWTFRQVAEMGTEGVGDKLLANEVEVVKDMFSAENAHIFVNNDPSAALAAGGGIESLAMTQARYKLDTFAATIDAASLVFAHSVLDAALLDYCRVIALEAPQAWAERFGNRRVPASEWLEHPQERMVQRLADEYVASLERASLLDKVDALFAVCRPARDYVGVTGFQFDRDRLMALDTLRHAFAHKEAPTKLPNGFEDIVFLQDVCNHMMGLIPHRFGLKMDPSALPIGGKA